MKRQEQFGFEPYEEWGANENGYFNLKTGQFLTNQQAKDAGIECAVAFPGKDKNIREEIEEVEFPCSYSEPDED